MKATNFSINGFQRLRVDEASLEPDGGATKIRNVASAHWKRLDPDHRCLVPFMSFSEYDTIECKKVPVWFAADESWPLMSFAGLWTSVRKAKEGEVTADIFGFLTWRRTLKSAAFTQEEMPVILTTPQEHNVWIRAPWEEAQGAAAAPS